jgi:hypothetical protein
MLCAACCNNALTPRSTFRDFATGDVNTIRGNKADSCGSTSHYCTGSDVTKLITMVNVVRTQQFELMDLTELVKKLKSSG